MQTQLKKIILGAAALLFVITGVSFAHDTDGRHHKTHGKAHGIYKFKKQHSPWNNKHHKFRKHYRDRYAWKDVHHHHYYEKYHRRSKQSHAQYRRPHCDRYRYREIRHHNRDYHRRPTPREDLIYKVALKDPGIIFKVILKEH